MTEREAPSNSSILNYLSALAKLYNFQANFTPEIERIIFSSWFVLNQQINFTSVPKVVSKASRMSSAIEPNRNLACLLGFLCFLANKSGSRLIAFKLAVTARIFDLTKLQESLNLCLGGLQTSSALPLSKDKTNNLIEKL